METIFDLRRAWPAVVRRAHELDRRWKERAHESGLGEGVRAHSAAASARRGREIDYRLRCVDQLASRINGTQEAIARLEQRRKTFAAFRGNRVEIPQRPARHQELGTIELEALRSAMTGRELAAKAQAEIEDLKAEVKQLERQKADAERDARDALKAA